MCEPGLKPTASAGETVCQTIRLPRQYDVVVSNKLLTTRTYTCYNLSSDVRVIPITLTGLRTLQIQCKDTFSNLTFFLLNRNNTSMSCILATRIIPDLARCLTAAANDISVLQYFCTQIILLTCCYKCYWLKQVKNTLIVSPPFTRLYGEAIIRYTRHNL